MVVDRSSNILHIQETKLSMDSMFRCVPNIWLLSHCQCVGALGSSGGFAICWDPRKVTPLYWISCLSALSMVASSLETGEMILVTNVYVPIDLLGKLKLRAHIRHVRHCHPFFPWIVAWDFNFFLSLEEKRGGLAHLGPSSKLLRQNIDLLHLFDVKPLNGLFTWNNWRVGNDAISECLDRFLVSCF